MGPVWRDMPQEFAAVQAVEKAEIAQVPYCSEFATVQAVEKTNGPRCNASATVCRRAGG